MTGEVVVVTGCTKGGIGHALCEEFAGKGCKVYATARRVEAIGDFKDTQIVRLRLDVTSDADVADVVKTVLDREGRIDIVVNNAARPLAEVSLLEAKITFDTNIFGPLRLAQAAFPHMAAKKSGRIVNIGSIMGDTPAPWGGVYGATKAALARISEILYMEAAPFNIHVMHISPGGVKTNIAMHALDQLDLPENSFYKPWLASMTRAIAHADGPLSLTAERFAQKVRGNT
ncbi:hypothetical protein EVJ58_g9879 [Rhodofomes roseus]|uniref:Short-subunit dehydrogenase n=1 Tax=Rhodofomes roseus TaxID=34475 RepID=A0A4Y9XVW0_9APHY|nr:hypothetical protein EVJ58_g9879 [Rhodofomes roseus]